MNAHSDEQKLNTQSIAQQLAAARRSQILDAATEVFAQKGFHKATIRAIARRGRVAEGTIYNYFDNKTDLLFGLLDRLNETADRPESLAALSGGRQEGGGLEEAFESLIAHRLREVGAQLPLLRAVVPELLFHEELRSRYLTEILGPTTELARNAFDRLVAAGALRPTDTEVTVRLVAGLVVGTVLLEMLGDPVLPERRRELPMAITQLLLQGLGTSSGEGR